MASKRSDRQGRIAVGIANQKSSETVELRSEFYQSVSEVVRTARGQVYRAINAAMVDAYWHVGRMIVEEEQQGKERAEYGARLIANLSVRLTREFGKGFDETNLWNFKQFFMTFPPESGGKQKPDALRRELTWTHYRYLMRVDNPAARMWYLQEASEQNWSSRALSRQINSLYYERLLMSRDRAPVIAEMREKTAPLAAQPKDLIKDPIVLEFLGIEGRPELRESELEQAIIGKLQAFMLELGKGFAFVGRQYRVSSETKDFFVDLVFYNHILKCFVLIDLKSGDLTHQDIGQMDMYVRIFDDKVKGVDDNPTVGLILCAEKDQTVARYSVLSESQQLFASKYRHYLPTEEELRAELERERGLAVREPRVLYGAYNSM